MWLLKQPMGITRPPLLRAFFMGFLLTRYTKCLNSIPESLKLGPSSLDENRRRTKLTLNLAL